ncbi:MAG TPA: hypothetical protein VMS14_02635 [Ilumatobacteraceae bacterium]|nr:hypothetical protein [Ilumatobacteraceae bacterium]
MAAQGWFMQSDIAVAPGTTVVVQLTVVNLADSTDSFIITPYGMAAGYTTVEPATVTLFGGAQEVVDLHVRPPMLPTTTAGPTSLSVRIVPQRDPDNIATAETTLLIGDSFDRRINLLQPAQRGRRGAGYELMVENRGNTLASVRMHLVDSSGRVEGDFDPPAVGVEPGGSALVRLKLHAKVLQWERRSRTIAFRVDADQAGAPTASAPATFVQAPVVPERLGGRLAAIAGVIAALAIAWVAIVNPAIDDAAKEAVAELGSGTTTTSAPTDSAQVPTDSTPTDGGEDPLAGTITNLQLPVAVAQGQTGANQYTVPDGSILQVTDLIVQNPQLDQGTLTVSRDTVTLLTYNLGNVFTDVAVPLVTPIELQGGEQLVITVSCVGVGDQTATTCNPAVLFSGRLLDA